MPVGIVDGTGLGNFAEVNANNELKVTTASGTTVVSGTGLEDFTLRYKQLLDYEGSYNPIYIGLAVPGTGTGSAGWMIRKNVYDSGQKMVSGLFSSGNNIFDKIWDDRSGTGEAYS